MCASQSQRVLRVSPLDLRRLAVRIESLQRTTIDGWRAGDEMDFRKWLPGGRGHLPLPDPAKLREMDPAAVVMGDWQVWLRRALHLEGLVRDNQPGSPRRLLDDIQRGKFPRRR